MRRLLLPLLFASPLALAAEPQCTRRTGPPGRTPRNSQAQLRDRATRSRSSDHQGNCYEIYGFDKDRRKVEIYHDPVSGKAVKSEIDS